MKRILTLALLISAFCASAAEGDSYLYWMITEDATLGGKQFTSSDYYAKVRVADGEYLNFYANPGDVPAGNILKIDNSPVFSGVIATAPEALGFFIELYSDDSGDSGSLVGQAILPFSAENIATVGMDHASYALVSSFASIIPEPSSALLLLVGVAGLALRRKRAFRG